MIIKVVRGSFFGGVIDYVTRRGKYAGQGDARVLDAPGLFDHRTFAAQLAYDAARDPKRSKPVVHLIARAERSLTDAQYSELGNRMLKVARLEGRAHIKVVHDQPDDHEDNGHLHLVVCEVDDEGKVPARFLWDKVNRREVTAEAVRHLPKRSVESRAWDSQLAWRLTALAREIELEWGLRQLSSKRAARNSDEPQISRPQQEHLTRTGLVPLQDRFFHEVRHALALPTWDERAAALAVHALVLRPHEVKGRVRGLMVQSINNSKDAVKVSAFDLGGMQKLDASADMPFLTWHPEYKAAVNLRKTNIESRNDHWRATQRQFRLHYQHWQAAQKRRNRAFNQYKRARARIIAEFDARLSDEPDKFLHRDIRAERSGELALIKADRDFALLEAGSKAARPTFADFVAQRADQGDAAAAEVRKDLLSRTSETRRQALDEHRAQIAKLAEAANAIRAHAARLRAQLSGLVANLRDSVEPARKQAVRIQAVALRRHMTASKLARKARDLAKRLIERLDSAGHRIRVAHGRVIIDRFQPEREAQGLINDPAHLPMFQDAAERQSLAIRSLCDAVGGRAALGMRDGRMTIDIAALPAGVHAHLRWQGEPEVRAVLGDLHQRHDQERTRAAAEFQAEKNLRMSGALAAHRLKAQATAARVADLRAKLVAAAQEREEDSHATAIYLSAWRSALQNFPASQMIDDRQARTIEIGAIKEVLNAKAYYGEHVVKKVIAARTPAMAILGPDARPTDWAETMLNAALEQPDIKRRADENRVRAAEEAEMSHRFSVLDRMEQAARVESASDGSWANLYSEILPKRPVDLAAGRHDLYRSIDREIAAKLLQQGVPWTDVRHSFARLSPLSSDHPGGVPFKDHVDATMAESVAELPPAEQRKREAERRSWIRQMRPSRSDGNPVETHISLPMQLSAAPSASSSSIDASRLRQAPAREARRDAVQQRQDTGRFFAPDGQPHGPLKELLEDIQQNRGDYKLRDGQLIAPGWADDDQKSLQIIQEHSNIGALLKRAFEQGKGKVRDPRSARPAELER
ncbi:hypothetical protein Sphch_3030 [Sphingobium chlorophenolicum L-1]|uniref:Uncharacterized protein n=1 Tax=Sphingobium chlorophenolicum L-1 TaxID=690566 RepID=F6F2J2_SPHCR|nr:hypothetical protein [Sphingobium chlorophenolicum]AEG50654.1 hypothetical protein Sphch_3030 [Sphingobium chlorophenolicum L-1]